MTPPSFAYATAVCATVRLPAFHSWPDAPEDVGHLRSRHRHLLTVRLWVEVTDPDRQVEFHQLQREMHRVLFALYPARVKGELELGHRSCEQVARDLLDRTDLGCTPTGCEVWEDDENGALVTREQL